MNADLSSLLQEDPGHRLKFEQPIYSCRKSSTPISKPEHQARFAFDFSLLSVKVLNGD